MFKCGDKCTGILAAHARLVREKVCYENAKKEKDERVMKATILKIHDTEDYIKIMDEWPPAVNLAIKPALMVARIRSDEKRAAIMRQVQRAQETGINPMNGAPLGICGVTGIIIRYLIAKHDKKPFVREKRFLLTRENIDILKYLMSICQDNAKAACFLQSLMGVA